MTKYISILRGINVGGKRKILMSDLKELYSSIGFKNCISYIQSGNIIFDSEESPNIIKEKIEKLISENYDFEVPVIIKTISEIDEAININPFIVEKIEKLHLTFLSDIPKKEFINQLNNINFGEDKFEVIGKNIFICCEGKYHESKLTNNFLEKKLQVSATTRNLKTVNKIYELLK